MVNYFQVSVTAHISDLGILQLRFPIFTVDPNISEQTGTAFYRYRQSHDTISKEAVKPFRRFCQDLLHAIARKFDDPGGTRGMD
jgi:hypothetical protein